MSIRYIFFDLDGTLLPMDQDIFIKAYFGGLAAHLAPHGYEPKKLIDAVWRGTMAMIQNDGTQTNETVFWNQFAQLYTQEIRQDEPLFAEFYRTGFQNVQKSCGYNGEASRVVSALKEQGFTLVLATNPIFPAIATESRMAWAGLNREDFALYTTYENSSFCKPNPKYYREILDKLGITAGECLMVGNDATEDLAAAKLGMKVFLLTDCLINKAQIDLTPYPHGDFSALMEYIQTI